jgi:DNA-binding transcriptional LysR family regulator
MASDTGIRALLDRELPAPAVLPKALYEVSHLATVIGLIQEGVAVSVLPALAAPREARLCLRPIEDPPVYRVLGLIAARDRSLTPAAEAFRDVLLSMLGSGRTPRLQDVRILRQDAAGRGGATPSSSAPAGIHSAARRGR